MMKATNPPRNTETNERGRKDQLSLSKGESTRRNDEEPNALPRAPKMSDSRPKGRIKHP